MIEICIGSACHINGSYQIVQEFKRLLQEHHLTQKVEFKSAFCLGKCGDGVSIRINGDQIHKVQVSQVEAFFEEHILGVQ